MPFCSDSPTSTELEALDGETVELTNVVATLPGSGRPLPPVVVMAHIDHPTPKMDKIIFSSNLGGNEREFDLWLVPMSGMGEPERVTHTAGFDGFPMFSPNGKWLVFASNRATAEGEHDTNLFLAKWTD